MANFYARYNGGLFGGGGGGGGTAPLADTAAITNGQSSVAVLFGTGFASTPVVVASVASTTPGNQQFTVQITSLSTAGFTAELSSSVGDGTYSLKWIASAVND